MKRGAWKQSNWSLVGAAVAIAAVAMTGCQHPNRPGDVAGKDEVKRSFDAAEKSGEVGSHTKIVGDRVRAIGYYPTGMKSGSAIMIERKAPASVIVGEAFDYTMTVTNMTGSTLQDVVVNGKADTAFKVTGSTPQGSPAGGGTSWTLGDLGPRQSKNITVSGSATKVGELIDCATVSFTPYTCLAIDVIQPALKLTKQMTPEVLKCEPIEVNFVVTNTGTGHARNVVIRDELPEGLVTAKENSRTLTANVGSLPSGESRKFKATLKALKTGTFSNTAKASAEGVEEAAVSARVIVREPKLAIAKTGPAKQFIGRNATYTIKVSNTGDGEARNTVVEDILPAGSTFVSASEGGAATAGKVTWNLGTLAAGGSNSMTVTVKQGSAGEIKNSAMARAFCATAVNDAVTTKITGIPAVLLEVVDDNDPVEVGGQTTYTITVTNQGSAPDTNIRIVATLTPNQEYVAGKGVTPGTARGKVVTFDALPTLAPKMRATWRITIKAADAENARFKVVMTTDELGPVPVQETEATNMYE